MLRAVQWRMAHRGKTLHTLRRVQHCSPCVVPSREMGLAAWLGGVRDQDEQRPVANAPHVVVAGPRDPSYQKSPVPVASHSVPLTAEFPGMPAVPADLEQQLHSSAGPVTELTTLSNQFRVATEKNFGQASAFALFVESGAVYEDNTTHGVSHLMERLAFKSTKHRTTRELVQELELMGGSVVSSNSREMMVHTADVVNHNLKQCLEIMADSLLHPSLEPDEFEEVKQQIAIEYEDLTADLVIPEVLHEVAYKGQPLGRSFIPPASMADITVDMVKEFHSKHYTADRIVLATTGFLQHTDIVKISQDIFGTTPAAQSRVPFPTSTYIGGTEKIEEDPALAPKNPKDKLLSHLIIGFEGPGVSDQDLYAMSVIHTLLGGGGSFSSGGPGKGMYSRLYMHVLNGNGFVESASAFSSAYIGTGLFGVYATVKHGYLMNVTNLILGELVGLSRTIRKEEFMRAKKQLKSAIFMNLESRSIQADDIGRQVLLYGRRISAKEICQIIDQLTINDLQQVLRKVLLGNPTLVVYGKDIHKYDVDDSMLKEFLKKELA